MNPELPLPPLRGEEFSLGTKVAPSISIPGSSYVASDTTGRTRIDLLNLEVSSPLFGVKLPERVFGVLFQDLNTGLLIDDLLNVFQVEPRYSRAVSRVCNAEFFQTERIFASHFEAQRLLRRDSCGRCFFHVYPLSGSFVLDFDKFIKTY